jgi:hypothetical protein
MRFVVMGARVDHGVAVPRRLGLRCGLLRRGQPCQRTGGLGIISGALFRLYVTCELWGLKYDELCLKGVCSQGLWRSA